MKKRFQKVFAFLGIFALLISNPATILYVDALSAEDARPSVTVGSLENEGDIQVTKSVKAKDPDNGIFEVTFDIRSKGTMKTQPIYSIVVFDRSGSMRPPQSKWDNAKTAALTYANTLNNGTNQFGFVRFNGTAEAINYAGVGKHKFSTQPYTDTWLAYPDGGTRLYQALIEAEKYIENAPAGVKPVIVVISDGAADDYAAKWNPSHNDYEQGMFIVPRDLQEHPENITEDYVFEDTTWLKNLKEKATIYSIGYSLKDEAEAKQGLAKAILKCLTTSDGKYIEADVNTLISEVEKLAQKVSDAAEGAELIEVPNSTNPPGFTLGENEKANKKLEVASINQETKEVTYKPITYELQIDVNSPTDVYETNNKSETRIAIGDEVLFNVSDSPSVYWERPDRNYTVNHYKESINGEKIGDSDSGTAEIATPIPYETRTVKGYKFDHLEDKDGNIVNSVSVTDNSANNVLNVIYTKKDDLEYKVVYHYEDVNGQFTETIEDDGNPHTATFGDSIDVDHYKEVGLNKKDEGTFVYNSHILNPESGTIDDEEDNTLDIFYTREKYDYCVKYFYDDVEDTSKKVEGTDRYGKMISYEDKNKEGYRFLKVLPSASITISKDSSQNEIDVYYVKDDFEYTVKYYKDEIAGDPFKTENESAEFESTIPYDKTPPKGYKFVHVEDKDGNVVEGLSVTENPNNNILNVLFERDIYDYQIDYYYDENKDDSKTEYGQAAYQTTINGYPDKVIEGYTLDREENLPLTIDTKDNLINVFYAKRTDLSYVVQYYYDGVLDEDATVYYVNQTFGDKITKYIDKAKDGYTLDRVENLPLTISVDKEKNIIKVYYVNTAKDEAIEIPNTSTTHSSANGGELLLFSILGLEIILRRKRAEKRLS